MKKNEFKKFLSRELAKHYSDTISDNVKRAVKKSKEKRNKMNKNIQLLCNEK
jgi:hypothetical protein